MILSLVLLSSWSLSARILFLLPFILLLLLLLLLSPLLLLLLLPLTCLRTALRWVPGVLPSLTSAHLLLLSHLLLLLPLSLPRLLLLLLLSRRRPPLILSSLLPLGFPPFHLLLLGLLLMYQGGMRVFPSLLGFPPLSIMRQSIPLSPCLTLPPGLPLMTLMPTLIHYRVRMTMVILTIVSVRMITLILIPQLPQLPRFL